MAITLIKDDAKSLIPRSWRKLIIDKMNLLIASTNSNALSDTKTYMALISQSGASAPTVKVQTPNGIGTIVWTRVGAGNYLGTLSGAFTLDKTLCFIGNTQEEVFVVSLRRASANTVEFITVNSAGVMDDYGLTDLSIQIIVYP